LSDRDFLLDSLTTCSLVELADKTTGFPLARLNNSPLTTLAMVYWQNKAVSVIPLPIFKENYNDIFTGADKANDPDIAKMRILFRGMLVDNEALQNNKLL